MFNMLWWQENIFWIHQRFPDDNLLPSNKCFSRWPLFCNSEFPMLGCEIRWEKRNRIKYSPVVHQEEIQLLSILQRQDQEYLSYWICFIRKIKICIVGGGIKVHYTLRPLNGLLCQPRVIMVMEKSVEWLTGDTEVLGENLPQCRFIHHKPHMLPVSEPVPPRWEASV
jgi:hypothetical protein